MNYSDHNGEKLSESIILTIYAQYKHNEALFADDKLSQEDYNNAKAGILACTSALLYGSNISKNAMLQCGFFTTLLNELIEISDSLLLDDVKMATKTVVGRTSTSQSNLIHLKVC